MEQNKQSSSQQRKKYAPRGKREQMSLTFRIDESNLEHLRKQSNKGRYVNELIARDAAASVYAVRIYDTTCNTPGHESQAVTSSVELSSVQLRDCNDSYGITREAAEQLQAELQQQAVETGISWAHFEVERAPLCEE